MIGDIAVIDHRKGTVQLLRDGSPLRPIEAGCRVSSGEYFKIAFCETYPMTSKEARGVAESLSLCSCYALSRFEQACDENRSTYVFQEAFGKPGSFIIRPFVEGVVSQITSEDEVVIDCDTGSLSFARQGCVTELRRIEESCHDRIWKPISSIQLYPMTPQEVLLFSPLISSISGYFVEAGEISAINASFRVQQHAPPGPSAVGVHRSLPIIARSSERILARGSSPPSYRSLTPKSFIGS